MRSGDCWRTCGYCCFVDDEYCARDSDSDDQRDMDGVWRNLSGADRELCAEPLWPSPLYEINCLSDLQSANDRSHWKVDVAEPSVLRKDAGCADIERCLCSPLVVESLALFYDRESPDVLDIILNRVIRKLRRLWITSAHDLSHTIDRFPDVSGIRELRYLSVETDVALFLANGEFQSLEYLELYAPLFRFVDQSELSQLINCPALTVLHITMPYFDCYNGPIDLSNLTKLKELLVQGHCGGGNPLLLPPNNRYLWTLHLISISSVSGTFPVLENFLAFECAPAVVRHVLHPKGESDDLRQTLRYVELIDHFDKSLVLRATTLDRLVLRNSDIRTVELGTTNKSLISFQDVVMQMYPPHIRATNVVLRQAVGLSRSFNSITLVNTRRLWITSYPPSNESLIGLERIREEQAFLATAITSVAQTLELLYMDQPVSICPPLPNVRFLGLLSPEEFVSAEDKRVTIPLEELVVDLKFTTSLEPRKYEALKDCRQFTRRLIIATSANIDLSAAAELDAEKVDRATRMCWRRHLQEDGVVLFAGTRCP